MVTYRKQCHSIYSMPLNDYARENMQVLLASIFDSQQYGGRGGGGGSWFNVMRNIHLSVDSDAIDKNIIV